MDLIPNHLNVVAAYRKIRIFQPLTASYIISPPMPRTLHHVTGEDAFTQRTPCVRARVVHSVDGAFHIDQGDPSPLRLNRDTSSRLEIRELCDRNEFGHSKTLLVPSQEIYRQLTDMTSGLQAGGEISINFISLISCYKYGIHNSISVLGLQRSVRERSVDGTDIIVERDL